MTKKLKFVKQYLNDYHRKRSEEAMKAVNYYKRHPLSEEEFMEQFNKLKKYTRK
jgi:hypothetical protein